MDLEEDRVKKEASGRRTSLGIVAQTLSDEVLLKGVLQLKFEQDAYQNCYTNDVLVDEIFEVFYSRVDLSLLCR